MVAPATPDVGQSTISNWPTRCASLMRANTPDAVFGGGTSGVELLLGRRVDGAGVVESCVDEGRDEDDFVGEPLVVFDVHAAVASNAHAARKRTRIISRPS